MLKGNLSTRPFYNGRLVSAVLAVVAVGAVALTAFNVTELRSLSAQRAEYSEKIASFETETRGLEVKTAELTRTVDVPGMKRLTNDAREANDLIDKRTFSWTAFLSVIEKTLPYGARLVEVAPKPEKGVMHVAMIVVCQTPEDLYTLIEALEKTNAFRDVVPTDQSPNDDHTETATVQAVYLGPPGDPPPAAGKKTGKGRP